MKGFLYKFMQLLRSEVLSCLLIYKLYLGIFWEFCIKPRDLTFEDYYLPIVHKIIKGHLNTYEDYRLYRKEMTFEFDELLDDDEQFTKFNIYYGEYLLLKRFINRFYTLITYLNFKLNITRYLKFKDAIFLKFSSLRLLMRSSVKTILYLVILIELYCARLFPCNNVVKISEDFEVLHLKFNEKTKSSLKKYLSSRLRLDFVLFKGWSEIDDKELWYTMKCWNTFIREYLFLKGNYCFYDLSLKKKRSKNFMTVFVHYYGSFFFEELICENADEILNQVALYKYFDVIVNKDFQYKRDSLFDLTYRRSMHPSGDEFQGFNLFDINALYVDSNLDEVDFLVDLNDKKYFGELLDQSYDYDEFIVRVQDYERERQRNDLLMHWESMQGVSKILNVSALRLLRFNIRKNELLFFSIRKDMIFYYRLKKLKGLLSPMSLYKISTDKR